ncbi:hypothetical protein NR798_28635 [Archangium gephyra]|uniref:hypothetical protein n=1 Tax=Archangium gephyra TaxID=48 RepID=UPI0035D4FDE5
MALSFSATAVGPLRAEVAIEWDVRGCSPSGVELVGEAGQVVSVSRGDVVPVVNLTRPGSPMIERFGLWARVTCDDGRSQVAGPFIVQDVIRATEIRALNTDWPNSRRTRLLHMPEGVFLLWHDQPAINDPTVTLERLAVLDASGQEVRSHGLGQHVTGEAEAPSHPFWFEGSRLVWGGTPSYFRSFYDYTTGGGSPSPYIDRTAPPPAFTFPAKPDALRSWKGLWAPHADGSPRAWLERGSVVALVDLGG